MTSTVVRALPSWHRSTLPTAAPGPRVGWDRLPCRTFAPGRRTRTYVTRPSPWASCPRPRCGDTGVDIEVAAGSGRRRLHSAADRPRAAVPVLSRPRSVGEQPEPRPRRVLCARKRWRSSGLAAFCGPCFRHLAASYASALVFYSRSRTRSVLVVARTLLDPGFQASLELRAVSCLFSPPPKYGSVAADVLGAVFQADS